MSAYQLNALTMTFCTNSPTKREVSPPIFVWLMILFGLCFQSTIYGQDAPAADDSGFQINSDNTTFDQALGIARAKGNVEIKIGGTVIQAGEAEFHQTTGKVYARDNARVFKDGALFTGEEIIYDTNTGEVVSNEFRSSFDPVFYEAENIKVPTGDEGQMIELHDATLTSHDNADPNFRVKAKTIRIYPGERVVFKNLKVYAGNAPVLWLPYLSQPLDDELGYYFVPGFNSTWGAFLLNQYGFMIQDHTLAKAHLDLRSERGLAGGIEFESVRHHDNKNFGNLNLYYANDQDPQTAFNGRVRNDPVDSDRYRVNFQHRVYLPGPEESTLYLDIDINKLSDQYFYQDFFPQEFRTDPQPDNLINLVKSHPRGTISLLARAQLNDFFQTDTRLPELAVDVTNAPLFDSGLFYTGYTTVGILDEDLGYNEENLIAQRDANQEIIRQMQLGNYVIRGADLVDKTTGKLIKESYDQLGNESLMSTIERELQARGYGRFDTYHEISYPGQIGNFLNIVPKAGVGYTSYTNIDSPDIDSFDRTTLHAGIDSSLKFSKLYPEVENAALGLHGLRHIVQPYLNYSWVSTDEIGNNFTPIDRLSPTTRLRPLDIPRYTAVDGINDWNIVRYGIGNRFLTKRDGGAHNWLSINSYFESYLDDPEFNRDVSNLFTDVTWNPLPWMSAQINSQLPVFNDPMEFTEVQSNLYFMPTDWFRFNVGYYYLQDHPFFLDSNLVSIGTYTRLGEQWGFSTSHRFEAEDNTLEIQQYQLHRDLASWTAGIGAIIRDNRGGKEEFGILMSLTLKAFPRLSVPLDLEPGSGR